MQEFPRYLKSLIDRSGYSYGDIERLTGVSRSYLSLVCRGKRKNPPSPEVLRKLAGPLGVRHADLMEAAGHVAELTRNEAEAARVNVFRAFPGK